MRGCGCGCLSVLILAGVVTGLAWTVTRIASSSPLPMPATTAADGRRAQQKIYEVARGKDEVVLTDRELNALLSRHLADAPRMPLVGLIVGFPARDTVELAGRVPLARLLRGGAAAYLPERWRQRGAWVYVLATSHVDDRPGGRELLLDVRDWAVGRQHLPAWLLPAILDGETLRVLHWPLPETVEGVTVEPGRITIRSGAAR
jgi:hypothetical protein